MAAAPLQMWPVGHRTGRLQTGLETCLLYLGLRIQPLLQQHQSQTGNMQDNMQDTGNPYEQLPLCGRRLMH